MSRDLFIKRMFKCFSFLILGILSFPFIIQLAVSVTGPHSGGTGGAVALVAGTLLKPLFLLMVLYQFMLPIRKRLRGLEMNFGWVLLAFLSFAASWQFLFSFGNFWGANFSVGIMNARVPYSLMLFFGFILFVSALPDKRGNRAPEVLNKVAWFFAGIFATYFSIEFAPEVLRVLGPMIAYPLAFIGLKLPILYEWPSSAALFISTQILAFIPSFVRSSTYLIFWLVCCAIIVTEHRTAR